MDLAYLKQNYTELWQQRILNWCEKNAIEDIRPNRWGSKEWYLGWPTYDPDQRARVLRAIQISDMGGDFEAYSGAFTSHALPPVRAKWSAKRKFGEDTLEEEMNSLKKYAEDLKEDDLKEFYH